MNNTDASKNGALPIAYVQRIQSFSSAHRLHSPVLSDSENAALYGKCNHVNGHGHNYKVTVTLRGPISKETGMLINITDLKQYIEEVIMSTMDHKNIDKDVPFFKTHASTMENIAIYIFNSMKERVGDILYEIKLDETDKNVAIYRGEMTQ